MATRFEQEFARTTLQSRSNVARDWRTAIRDAAFRQRLHGVVLVLVSVVGVTTGLLVAGLGDGTLAGAGMGVYGLYLWRR